MKYSGSVTIIDDAGNSVFERELTQDEIIETLLNRVAKTESQSRANALVKRAPAGIVVPKEVIKVARKTVGSVMAGKKRGDAKECCGSKGVRHFKWCKEVGGTGVVGTKANKNQRIPFSESTYNTVKALLDSGTPAYAIVSDKGLDPIEIKKIDESKSYDRYFKS